MPMIQNSIGRVGCAVQGVLLGPGGGQCGFERHLGQLGHRAGDHLDIGLRLYVEHHQPLHHQLPRQAQRRGQRPAAHQPGVERGLHGRPCRRPGRQQRQIGPAHPAHPLHIPAVVGSGRTHSRLGRGLHGILSGLC
jgi:hypothetical protein